MVSVSSFTNHNDNPKKVNDRRKLTQIPRPAVSKGRPRSEKFCVRKTSETSTNLFICKTSAIFIDTGTCTENNVTETSTDMPMSGNKKDPQTEAAGILNQDNEYTKWMKQLQFPDTLQALFLSEKGLRKFQKIIQDQLNILEKKSGGGKFCTKHLPPISYYQIAETKSKSESDFVKVKRTGHVPETNILHQSSLPPFPRPKHTPDTNVEGSLIIKTDNSKYSSKGLLHIDEIKKDLISICAYIFKQTRIINELWKYLEKNSGSKHQLNKDNVKNITAGALNQHLTKLHSIRENLFKFNEKYRADLDKRIHLLKQISNYYKEDQQFPKAVRT